MPAELLLGGKAPAAAVRRSQIVLRAIDGCEAVQRASCSKFLDGTPCGNTSASIAAHKRTSVEHATPAKPQVTMQNLMSNIPGEHCEGGRGRGTRLLAARVVQSTATGSGTAGEQQPALPSLLGGGRRLPCAHGSRVALFPVVTGGLRWNRGATPAQRRNSMTLTAAL